MGPRGGIAVVVRLALIDMCLAEVVLVVVRVVIVIVEIGVASETGTARSAGSRIDMCLESAVAVIGTEVVMI